MEVGRIGQCSRLNARCSVHVAPGRREGTGSMGEPDTYLKSGWGFVF